MQGGGEESKTFTHRHIVERQVFISRRRLKGDDGLMIRGVAEVNLWVDGTSKKQKAMDGQQRHGTEEE